MRPSPSHPPPTPLRPLCLSPWVPPQPRPQAILIGKMIPEWLRQGVAPLIGCYEECGHWAIPAPLVPFSRFRRSRLAKLSRLAGGWLEAAHRRRTVDLLAAAARRHRADLIFSFANPMEANILGARLQERLGLPFIAHFSDPFADCPLKPLAGEKRRKALALERWILERAARVVFVSEALMARVLAAHPVALHARGVVIPHCFDPALHPPPPARQAGAPFVISHLGAFYAQRHPEGFLRAMARLRAESPQLAAGLRFRAIGGVDGYAGFSAAELAAMLDRHGLAEMVEVVPGVSYAESLERMAAADALLVIDADIPDSPYLPSKLIDYVGSGRPILAITPRGSPTWTVTREVGGAVFAPGEEAALVERLRALLTVPPGQPAAATAAAAARFQVQNTTGRLLRLFHTVLEEVRR